MVVGFGYDVCRVSAIGCRSMKSKTSLQGFAAAAAAMHSSKDWSLQDHWRASVGEFMCVCGVQEVPAGEVVGCRLFALLLAVEKERVSKPAGIV